MNRVALRSLSPFLIGGLLLLAAGVWVAQGVLPAWRLDGLASRQDLVARFRTLAQQAGVVLASGEPSLALVSRAGVEDPRSTEPVYVPEIGDEPVLVRVAHPASRGDGGDAELLFGLAPDGELRTFAWEPLTLSSWVSEVRVSGFQEEATTFARLLAPSGRGLGEPDSLSGLGAVTVLFPLSGEPPAHIEVYDPIGGSFFGFLRNGSMEESASAGPVSDITRLLLSEVPRVLAFLAVAGLFLAFLGRRRIDLINGACLSSITFFLLFLSSLFGNQGLLDLMRSFFSAFVPSLWVLLLWSTGESWLRALEPDFSTSLDALRVGRLGPRGGRALLGGLGLGAALAGIRLLMLEGTEATSFLGRTGLSVPLPVFGIFGNPISEGILLASTVLLLVVVCMRLLPRRWALGVATVAAAAVARPVPVAPPLLAVATGTVIVAGLVFALRRFELTGLLTAAGALFTLPTVVVSARLLDWMPGSFALTAALVLTAGTLGVVGLGREGEEEERGMGAPAFVRRLEDEKRLQHEMGLLARMQLGLLPEMVPRLDGWEISARSVLATEAGGDFYDFLWDDRGELWIAAGDVSGHGYSCAIIHAMTKAALASLVAPERNPSAVLADVDRVLRTVRYRRAFTSLALLRLDPESGGGVFANAGHPYPLLYSDGQVREIDLPGLPLGQGPPRRYTDLPLRLDTGSVLVLCSDGLFEASDREVSSYGFERAQQLLAKAARWPSNEVLEILLADWRRHRGPVAAADDTTVVVIKRLGEAGEREEGVRG